MTTLENFYIFFLPDFFSTFHLPLVLPLLLPPPPFRGCQKCFLSELIIPPNFKTQNDTILFYKIVPRKCILLVRLLLHSPLFFNPIFIGFNLLILNFNLLRKFEVFSCCEEKGN